ncbi:hypothetical protein [Cyanothece sp. BG0011]|uniref:hypothetical protein n=1 Tax=Cyanothece sp. BG0011 TaxID=2082950 RepID=UPI0018E53784|nr:hypothetical protein [Cyanothece sp. BG0011]
MKSSIEYVGTVKAASLLKICPQRVRQLLAEGRIKGAFKIRHLTGISLIKNYPTKYILSGKMEKYAYLSTISTD